MNSDVPEGTRLRGSLASSTRECGKSSRRQIGCSTLVWRAAANPGEIVAERTPEQVAQEPRSYTVAIFAG